MTIEDKMRAILSNFDQGMITEEELIAQLRHECMDSLKTRSCKSSDGFTGCEYDLWILGEGIRHLLIKHKKLKKSQAVVKFIDEIISTPGYGKGRQSFVMLLPYLKHADEKIMRELLRDDDVISHAIGALTGLRNWNYVEEVRAVLTFATLPLHRRTAKKYLQKYEQTHALQNDQIFSVAPLTNMTANTVIPVGAANVPPVTPLVAMTVKPMKRAEILKNIEGGDLSEETRDAFFKALRRSGCDFTRGQHCRSLACKVAALPRKDAFDYALFLIDYALEHYSGDGGRSDLYAAKGNVFFDVQRYEEAYSCFKKGEDIALALKNKSAGYIRGFELLLLKAVLLKDDFCYSAELERVFDLVGSCGILGMRYEKLYLLAAEIVIQKERANREAWQDAQRTAQKIIREPRPTPFETMFSRHKISDSLKVPQKLIDFLSSDLS